MVDSPAPLTDASLRRLFISGVAHSAVMRWSAQAMSWGATLVVARLLSPDDYGIMAMATVIHGLIAVICEFGVGTTIVTLRQLSPVQIAQFNTLASLLGVSGCVFMMISAPAIAAFFARPDVTPVVAVLGLTFLLSGLRTIPSALLQRDMRFAAISIVEAMQAVVGAATTLYGAWVGWGHWAIVAGLLSASAAWTMMLLVVRPAAFAWPRRSTLETPLSFTRHQLTGSVAWYWYSNADFVVAGRWLGAHDLGIYSMAWTLARVVPERIANIVVRATPAVFAAVSHEPARLRKWLTGVTEGLAVVCFPLLTALSVNADDVLRVVGGHQWDAATMPLRLLALYAMFDIVAQPVSRALVAAGYVRFTARLGLVLAMVMPVSFIAGVQAGPTGVAVAWLAIAPALRLAALLRLRSAIGLTLAAYARAVQNPALATCAMALSMWLARGMVPASSSMERLALAATTGAAAYLGLLLALQHRQARAYLRSYLAFRS